LLQLGVFIGKGVYFSGQAEEVEQLAVKSYQKLVPGTKSMSAQKLGRVIKGKLNQGASNGDVATNFLDLLGEAGYHYSQEKDAGGFSFQSISYSQQRGELIIELRAKNYEQVGRLQQAIAGAGLTAKISSAVQEKGYFRGRISVSGS
jgi:general secretion pathway protein L